MCVCVAGGRVGVTLGDLAPRYVRAISCSKARSSQITPFYQAFVSSILGSNSSQTRLLYEYKWTRSTLAVARNSQTIQLTY